MDGGFKAPTKRKLGEGSGAMGGGGGSGAVAGHGGWSDPAAAAASTEVFFPKKKKKKNRLTRTKRGLKYWKLGLRAPAFEEFFNDDISEEEPDDEVEDDKESRDKKSRHVLKQLRLGKWDYMPAVGKYSCPFCHKVKPQDYDWMVAHAIGVGSDGHSRPAHVRAKHAPYGVFLQRMMMH